MSLPQSQGLRELSAAAQTRALPTAVLKTWGLELADWLGPSAEDVTSQSPVTEAPGEKGWVMPVHLHGFVPGKETEARQRVSKGQPSQMLRSWVKQGFSPGPWPGLPWEPIPLPSQEDSQLRGLALPCLTSCWGERQFSLHGTQDHKAWEHHKAQDLVLQVGEVPVPAQYQAVGVGDSELAVGRSHEQKFTSCSAGLTYQSALKNSQNLSHTSWQLSASIQPSKKYQRPSTGKTINWLTRTFLRMFRRPQQLDTGSRQSRQMYQHCMKGPMLQATTNVLDEHLGSKFCQGQAQISQDWYVLSPASMRVPQPRLLVMNSAWPWNKGCPAAYRPHSQFQPPYTITCPYFFNQYFHGVSFSILIISPHLRCCI